MRRLLVLVALAAAAPAVAPARAPAAASGFRTPSGNIHCQYISEPRFLRCDMLRIENSPPPKPSSCEFDYGQYFGLTTRGAGRRLCVSDTAANPSSPVLGYDQSFKRGGYVCRSRTTYLRCTNARGHGFQLSRARQTVF